VRKQDIMTDSIYREIILDHFKNPRNKGTLDPHDYSAEDVNPLCGDEVRIDLRVNDDVVSEVRFEGRGCAVSQASASILTEMIEGKSLAELKALTKDDLLEEIGIPVSPARLKCALLPLNVLRTSISGGAAERIE
jgi:nitrogen fixation NifU-like protein